MEEKPIQDADGGNCYSVLTFCYGKMDEPAARNSDFFPTPISLRCVITVLP